MAVAGEAHAKSARRGGRGEQLGVQLRGGVQLGRRGGKEKEEKDDAKIELAWELVNKKAEDWQATEVSKLSSTHFRFAIGGQHQRSDGKCSQLLLEKCRATEAEVFVSKAKLANFPITLGVQYEVDLYGFGSANTLMHSWADLCRFLRAGNPTRAIFRPPGATRRKGRWRKAREG